jgi:hypothetical protein
MRMRTPTRVVWAISLLFCVVAILLIPGSTSIVVRSHGKQLVRVVSSLSLLTLASVVVYRDLLRPPAAHWLARWQAFRGSGPNLLHETCVLRC